MFNPTFTRIILDKLHEVLKPIGFRKQGSTFTKKIADDVILVVNLQKSASSTRGWVKATVNLGVFSLPLAHRLAEHGFWVRTVNSPTAADCHWRQRLGHLMPQQRDL